MGQEQQSLSWVTPAKYVGPAVVIIFIILGLLAGWFAISESFTEAIITLLFAICFLLLGIIDLVGELILLARKKVQPSDA